MHSVAVSDLRLILQASLGVANGLLEREVVPPGAGVRSRRNETPSLLSPKLPTAGAYA